MDLSKIKDTKDLVGLLDLMGKYDLVELEMTDAGRSLRLRKAEAAAPAREVVHVSPVGHGAASPSAGGAEERALGAEADPNQQEVTSPMVGSFYRAPSPEADPFVQEGDRIQADTTLCIIEAMKVMNEIPAGVAGIVREILVKNGDSVEYGQPLFRVEIE